LEGCFVASIAGELNTQQVSTNYLFSFCCSDSNHTMDMEQYILPFSVVESTEDPIQHEIWSRVFWAYHSCRGFISSEIPIGGYDFTFRTILYYDPSSSTLYGHFSVTYGEHHWCTVLPFNQNLINFRTMSESFFYNNSHPDDFYFFNTPEMGNAIAPIFPPLLPMRALEYLGQLVPSLQELSEIVRERINDDADSYDRVQRHLAETVPVTIGAPFVEAQSDFVPLPASREDSPVPQSDDVDLFPHYDSVHPFTMPNTIRHSYISRDPFFSGRITVRFLPRTNVMADILDDNFFSSLGRVDHHRDEFYDGRDFNPDDLVHSFVDPACEIADGDYSYDIGVSNDTPYSNDNNDYRSIHDALPFDVEPQADNSDIIPNDVPCYQCGQLEIFHNECHLFRARQHIYFHQHPLLQNNHAINNGVEDGFPCPQYCASSEEAFDNDFLYEQDYDDMPSLADSITVYDCLPQSDLIDFSSQFSPLDLMNRTRQELDDASTEFSGTSSDYERYLDDLYTGSTCGCEGNLGCICYQDEEVYTPRFYRPPNSSSTIDLRAVMQQVHDQLMHDIETNPGWSQLPNQDYGSVDRCFSLFLRQVLDGKSLGEIRSRLKPNRKDSAFGRRFKTELFKACQDVQPEALEGLSAWIKNLTDSRVNTADILAAAQTLQTSAGETAEKLCFTAKEGININLNFSSLFSESTVFNCSILTFAVLLYIRYSNSNSENLVAVDLGLLFLSLYFLGRGCSEILVPYLERWAGFIVPQNLPDFDLKSFMLKFVSWGVFNETIPETSFSDLVKNLSWINHTCKTVKDFVGNAFDFFNTVLVLLANFFGDWFKKLFSSQQLEVHRINGELITLVRLMDRRECPTGEIVERMRRIIADFDNLERQVKALPSNTFMLAWLNFLSRKKIIVENFVKTWSSSDLRMEPAMLVITGVPGGGKTTTSPDIAEAMVTCTMSLEELLDFLTRPGAMTFAPTLGSDFWDAYKGEIIVFLNDFMSCTEAEGMPTHSGFLIMAKGCNRLVLNCAHLENKDEVELKARLLSVNTNCMKADGTKLKSLSFVGALTRRLDENCWVQYLKPEFRSDAKFNGDSFGYPGSEDGDDKYLYNLDTEKVSQVYGNNFTNDIFLYDQWSITNGRRKVGGLVGLSHDEVKEVCKDYYRRHVAKSNMVFEYRQTCNRNNIMTQLRERFPEHADRFVEPEALGFDQFSKDFYLKKTFLYQELLAAYFADFHSVEGATTFLDWIEVRDLSALDEGEIARFKQLGTLSFQTLARISAMNFNDYEFEIFFLAYRECATLSELTCFKEPSFLTIMSCYFTHIFRSSVNFSTTLIDNSILFFAQNKFVNMYVTWLFANNDPVITMVKSYISGLAVGVICKLVYHLICGIVTHLLNNPKEEPVEHVDRIRMVEVQGSSDDINTVLRKEDYITNFVKNCFGLQYRRRLFGDDDWKYRQPTNFLGVCGRSGLTVHHAWANMFAYSNHGYEIEVALLPFYNTRRVSTMWIPINDLKVCEKFKSDDLVKITFPPWYPCFANKGVTKGKKTSQFLSLSNPKIKDFFETPRRIMFVYLNRVGDDHFLQSKEGFMKPADLARYQYDAVLGGDDGVVFRVLRYEHKSGYTLSFENFVTKQGNCTSIGFCIDDALQNLCSEDHRAQNPVPVYLHTAGNKDNFHGGKFLDRDFLEDWFKDDYVLDGNDIGDSINTLSRNICSLNNVVGEAGFCDLMGATPDIPPYQHIVGTLPKKNVVLHSDIEKSRYFWNLFGGPTHYPARLKGFISKLDGRYVDPYKKARVDYGKPPDNALSDVRVRLIASLIWQQMFEHSDKLVPPHTLTFEEAVGGVKSLKIKPLPRDTSSGFYMGLVKDLSKSSPVSKKGKRFLLGCNEAIDFHSDGVLKTKETVDYILSQMIDDSVPVRQVNLSCSWLKDELRERIKMLEGKTRMFEIIDGYFSIISKMLTGSCYSFVVQNAIRNGVGIGINRSTDFDILYQYLNQFPNKISGDFGKFDKWLFLLIMDCAFDFIRKFYACDTPQNNSLRESYFEDLKSSVHVYYDQCQGLPPLRVVVNWLGGLRSGDFLTALVGSLCGKLIVTLAMVMCCCSDYHKFNQIPLHIIELKTRYVLKESYQCNAGDDNILSLSESLSQYVSFRTLKPVIEFIGLEYTSSYKDDFIFDYQPFQGKNCVTFLKRRFKPVIYDGNLYHVGLLDSVSLEKGFSWEKGPYDWRIRKDFAQNALVEASVDEKYCFDYYKEKILGAFKHHQPSINFEFTDQNLCLVRFFSEVGVKNYTCITVDENDVEPQSSNADITGGESHLIPPTTGDCIETAATCLVENDGGSSNTASVPLNTSIPHVNMTIGDYLTRLYPVGAGTYTTSTNANTELTMGGTAYYDLESYFATTDAAAKIKGFNNIDSELVFRIEVTRNPYHQGALLLHHLPNYADIVAFDPAYPTRHNAFLVQKFQHPCTMCIIPDQDFAELVVPYVAPTTHYNLKNGKIGWGRVFVTAVTPLLTGAAATDVTVYFEAYLYVRKLNLATPVYPQMDLADKEQKGLISSSLSKVSKAATVLGDIPVISEPMKSLAWVARTLSQVVSIFGFSRPTIDTPQMPMSAQTARYAASSTGTSSALPLALIHDNKTVADKSHSLRTMDEMTMKFLLSVRGYVGFFALTTSLSAGSIVPITDQGGNTFNQVNVGPRVASYGKTFLHTGKGPSVIYGNPTNALTYKFSHWTGSMDFELYFLNTKFHRCKLMITYTGNNVISSLPTVAQSMPARKILFTMGETKHLTFTCPYEMNVPWLDIASYAGALQMRVINTLTAPDVASFSVNILCFAKPGKDFRFGLPTDLSYGGSVPAFPVTPQSDLTDLGNSIHLGVIGGGPSSSFSIENDATCHGESVESIKQLLMKPSQLLAGTTFNIIGSHNMAFASSIAGIVSNDGAGAFKSAKLYGDQYSFFSDWFVYHRGKIRLFVCPFLTNSGATAGTYDQWNACLLPAGGIIMTQSTASTNASLNYANFNGAGLANITANIFSTAAGYDSCNPAVAIDRSAGQAEFEIPYYNTCPVSFNCVLDGTTTNTYGQSIGSLYYNEGAGLLVSWNNTGNIDDIRLMRSVSDDFSFEFFIGVPPLATAWAV
jgi:hypothetical protein